MGRSGLPAGEGRLSAPQARVAEDARRQLPDNVFKELYLAEPSDDAGNPFGLEAIRRNVAPLSGRPAEVWGWDLGKAVDFTVGIGLDASGVCAALVRNQLPWEATKRLSPSSKQAAHGGPRRRDP